MIRGRDDPPTDGRDAELVFKHEAQLDRQGIVTIRGGEIIEEYALDLRSGMWRRLTNRNWHQCSIHPED
jgi:hypothetical protein